MLLEYIRRVEFAYCLNAYAAHDTHCERTLCHVDDDAPPPDVHVRVYDSDGVLPPAQQRWRYFFAGPLRSTTMMSRGQLPHHLPLHRNYTHRPTQRRYSPQRNFYVWRNPGWMVYTLTCGWYTGEVRKRVLLLFVGFCFLDEYIYNVHK